MALEHEGVDGSSALSLVSSVTKESAMEHSAEEESREHSIALANQSLLAEAMLEEFIQSKPTLLMESGFFTFVKKRIQDTARLVRTYAPLVIKKAIPVIIHQLQTYSEKATKTQSESGMGTTESTPPRSITTGRRYFSKGPMHPDHHDKQP
ncbi:hypothetical protein AtubIFM56815_005775 [Aspergillus tubingensis]|uniref:Uncharacterized protein n=1 Tax=Aspergillus tubingensis TaxID=5068 RepID=A0A9W6AYQ6_ASPTU|nr:hypothetical protein AtubIFM54640_009089 [Aspergillus tubingensis]GLA90212.1 hypothetical protein AtubIFM56815_005775 [Aspergillus tubingensis]